MDLNNIKDSINEIAKDKKYRCKKTLMSRIYNNPEFKQLQDEIHLAG